MMTFFAVAGFLLTFADKVLGMDVSIHQLDALRPAAVAMAGPPIVPLCQPMTGAMNEDDLNRIELVRVTENCR